MPILIVVAVVLFFAAVVMVIVALTTTSRQQRISERVGELQAARPVVDMRSRPLAASCSSRSTIAPSSPCSLASTRSC